MRHVERNCLSALASSSEDWESQAGRLPTDWPYYVHFRSVSQWVEKVVGVRRIRKQALVEDRGGKQENNVGIIWTSYHMLKNVSPLFQGQNESNYYHMYVKSNTMHAVEYLHTSTYRYVLV